MCVYIYIILSINYYKLYYIVLKFISSKTFAQVATTTTKCLQKNILKKVD